MDWKRVLETKWICIKYLMWILLLISLLLVSLMMAKYILEYRIIILTRHSYYSLAWGLCLCWRFLYLQVLILFKIFLPYILGNWCSINIWVWRSCILLLHFFLIFYSLTIRWHDCVHILSFFILHNYWHIRF